MTAEPFAARPPVIAMGRERRACPSPADDLVPASTDTGTLGERVGTLRAGLRVPVLVAGCGNRLVRGDETGPAVLSALAGRLGPEADLRDVGTSVLGLLDLLDGQELLVVVDACAGKGRPGDVLVLEPALDELVPERVGTHQIGPVETLVVAKELYPGRMPERTVMVLVETAGLDDEAREGACERAAAEVLRIVGAGRRAGPVPAAATAEAVKGGTRG